MGQLAGVNWVAFITGHGWMPVYTSWEIGRVQLYLCKAVRTQWFISNCTFTAHFSVSFPYISLFKSWVVRHCPWKKSDVSWADPWAMEGACFSDQQARGAGWGSVWVLWCCSCCRMLQVQLEQQYPRWAWTRRVPFPSLCLSPAAVG